MVPAFEGIGWATLSVQVICVLYVYYKCTSSFLANTGLLRYFFSYYNGVFAWSIFYTFSALDPKKPAWERCNSPWNSEVRTYVNCS
ncbi:MAG: hypothetical protein GY847_05570, partial [Proteobacteria bacterium]|nr:hypothetical protein [Pseudomonadota bacterium]